MLAELFERIWSLIPFIHTRKRDLSCRDFSDDDDDMDIEVMVKSPKRPRMESSWNDSDFQSQQRPLETKHNGANWIAKSTRRFSQSFFTTMGPKHTVHPVDQRDFQEVITIDDDEDGPVTLSEVVVVSSDSLSGQAVNSSQPQWLKRPPLSRRSIAESRANSNSIIENAEPSSVRKKTNVQSRLRQSENKNSSQWSSPIKQKNSLFKIGMVESSRMHDLTDRENRPLGSRGSTAAKSVRLDERERYAEFLKIFSGNASQLDVPVWSTCTPKQLVVSDSRKENVVTKQKSPVMKQKLDNVFAEKLKERLRPNSSKAENNSILKTVHDSSADVIWISSSSRSPGVKIIERNISPRKVKLNLKAGATAKEIEVITLPSPEPKPKELSEGQKKPLKGLKEPLVGQKAEAIAESSVEAGPNPSITGSKEHEEPSAGLKDSMSRCKFQENPLLDSVYTKNGWLSNVMSRYRSQDELWNKQIESVQATVEKLQKQRDAEMDDKMKNVLRLQEIQLQDEEEEVQEIEKLVELTSDMLNKIKEALRPTPPNEVLIEAFNLKITRRDMETLNRDNWLNDEVINFYFTMLCERGKLDNYPSVHVCNTFFYPKLISNGHASLKRWTRKIDIFAHDMMLVPIHLGVHWCLAVVDFRHKKIQYFDSMSGKNQQCLTALKDYLEAESLDKKKVKLNTSDWSLEAVKDKPNQLNGSDCGMFTCKYAEYISRDAKITFTQEDMPYFRRRMVYEILTARLL